MRLRHVTIVLLPALLGGLCSSLALGQAIFVDKFDSAAELGSWNAPDWPLAEAVISHDPTMDAGGGTSPGALKVVANFQTADQCQPGCNLIRLERNYGWRVNVTGKILSYDIYVDNASAERNGGDHGWVEWMLRYYVDDANVWVESNPKQAGQNLGGGNDGMWYHVEVPMSVFTHPLTDTHVVEMQVWGGDTTWDNNMLIGEVTFWLDNVQLTDPEPPPPPATEPLVLNRFNDPAEVNTNDWYSPDWTEARVTRLEFDPDMDAGLGGAKSGSMVIEADFSNTYDCNDCADPNIPGDGEACIVPETPPHLWCNMIRLVRNLHDNKNLTGYGALEFDYYVSSDSPIRDGDHGWMEWWTDEASRPPGMNLGGGDRDDRWVHVTIPTSGAGAFPKGSLDSVDTVEMQIWGESPPDPRTMNGKVKMWIDNVVWTPPPQPPKGWHVFNEFDNADEVTEWGANEVGGAPPGITIEWDPTQDATGNAGSGSMKITVPEWNNELYQNEVILTKRIAPDPGVDFRDYTHITMRVKSDPSSVTTTWGATAGGGLVFRNLGFNWIYGAGWFNFIKTGSGVDENGWFVCDTYMKTPLEPQRNELIALTLQIYGDGGYDLKGGGGTFWIDHIRIGRPKPCTDAENCELCNNLEDDNGDGIIDCEDVDCTGTYYCPQETVCDDGIDDDGDGLVDCADARDCNESAHCKSNDPFADTDNDGDVDQEDFGAFQLCFSGAGTPAASGCGYLDRDLDLDVDIEDLAKFQLCASGPMLQASPACDNPG